jgi:hypothetical protein
MSEREELSSASTTAERLSWMVIPWLQPFWYAYVLVSWWQAGVSATRAGTALAASAAALVPAGKLAGFLSEAAFYVLWWRGRGRRLPFWRFFCVVASVSLADVFAIALAERAHAGPPALASCLAWVVGPQLLGDARWGSPALRVAFGSLGLLTVIRVALTANAQSRAVGARGAMTLAGTVLVWVLGRIAIWWITDLARGRSPLPIAGG